MGSSAGGSGSLAELQVSPVLCASFIECLCSSCQALFVHSTSLITPVCTCLWCCLHVRGNFCATAPFPFCGQEAVACYQCYS